jgi:Tfp pilus assembly protein PilN
MSLNSLLSGFGGGSEVYVTVSPACGLEMIEVDKAGNVKSYAQTPLDYNEAQREIANYEDFKNALQTLFQMRNINPQKALVHLSLPTVWFGLKEGLPLLLDDSAITNIVLGELEQTFIFKRKEPLPRWFDALASTNSDSRSVFYTAIQADAVAKIKEVLASMGAILASVECSLFADLKALARTGIAADQMQEGHSWSLMIVNNSGFQMVGLQGKRILEYYEEPLPLKSYEGEEIYAAIENAAQIALMSTPSSSLLVISETDLVSAEILASRLQFGGQTIAIEDNQFRKEPLMEMSLNIFAEDQTKVSLHIIGAMSPAGVMPVDIDYIAEGKKKKTAVSTIEIGGVEFTPMKLFVLVAIISAAILAPLYFGFNWTQNMMAQEQDKLGELDSQITALDAQIAKFSEEKGTTEFDPIMEIENVIKNNKTKVMAYAALGESIPQNLYLTYFLTADDGKINIKGCADSVEDVYVFFKNLKDALLESQLRISKLDLKAGSLDKVVNSTASTIDNAPYIFEITNMTDNEIKNHMKKLVAEAKKEKERKEKEKKAAEEYYMDTTPAAAEQPAQ